MTGSHTIEVEDALAFLATKYGTGVGSVAFLGEGAWSRAFAFTLDGRELVIRFGAHREDFDRDVVAAHHARPGLPIPAVLEVGPSGGDGWFAVSTRAHGAVLEKASSAAEWQARLPGLLALLDALRTVDLSATTGFGVWDGSGRAPMARWRDFLIALPDDGPGARFPGWRADLAESPYPVAQLTLREGFEQQLDLVDRVPEVRHLVHADLINGNVLVGGPDGTEVVAVFDWGCSLYGDFLFDVAWLNFWVPWYACMGSTDLLAQVRDHLDDTGVAVPAFDERIRACSLQIGLHNLAYNAHVNDWATLAQVATRLRTFFV